MAFLYSFIPESPTNRQAPTFSSHIHLCSTHSAYILEHSGSQIRVHTHTHARAFRLNLPILYYIIYMYFSIIFAK